MNCRLNFDSWELFDKGFTIIFLIILFLIPLYIFVNIIKSKDSICDSEKQSKFILECIKADTTKDVRAFGVCETLSIKLYCK